MKKIKFVAVAAMVLFLIVICAEYSYNEFEYSKANRFYEEENYVEAILLYRKMDDYKDSRSRRLTASYEYLFSYIKENNNEIKLNDAEYIITQGDNIIYKNTTRDESDEEGLKTIFDSTFDMVLCKNGSDVTCEKNMIFEAYYQDELYDQGVEYGKAEINRNMFHRKTMIEFTEYNNTMPVLLSDEKSHKEVYAEVFASELCQAVDSISEFLQKDKLNIDLTDLGFYIYK